MKVVQIHEIINSVTKEILGEEAVVQEDLSNIVQIGKQIEDLDKIDNYVKKLVDHIGKVVFKDRLYAGGAPSVMMDAWEYGSIMEKVSPELPTATENSSWELEDGKDYNPNIFYKPTVSAKFFNGKVTFDVPLSFTERQVKSAFSSASELNSFFSMLTTAVENTITVKLDALIMRTINNATGEVLAHDVIGEGKPKSTTRAVNLLAQYNETSPVTLDAKAALHDPNFLRYAVYQIGLYSDRLSKISTLFNIEGKDRFTPKDAQHIVLLSDFSKAATTLMQADAVNPENVALPSHESVPYWQGSGKGYEFENVSKIDVKTSTNAFVVQGGILGVMFDRDALGVTNLDRRVTTNYNARAEFYTNFYKFDAGYFNDLGENFVVFFIA